ncbi:MAG: hypothetical protein M0042_10685 [Nitrospiraceae bacterium]|nr:hypothetical protein [Nitrospiraceae bacterium]
MRRFFIAGIAAAFLVFLSGAAGADESGPFREGSVRMSLLFGNGTAFDQTYSIFGIGGGYYVLDGVELGIEAEFWRGQDPNITRVSPSATYVVPIRGPIRPYGGVFYRRAFIDRFSDQNDIGGRAGAFFLVGKGAYLGAGVVYEDHLSCDSTINSSCSELYPELIVAVLF